MDLTPIVDRYLAVWNEPDAKIRRDLIAAVFSEDATFAGPLAVAEGHDGIAEFALGIKEHLPGHLFRRTGAVDAHHDRFRFNWEIVPPGEQPRFAAGVDFGVLADDGRLRAVTAFVDQAPVFDGGNEP